MRLASSQPIVQNAVILGSMNQNQERRYESIASRVAVSSFGSATTTVATSLLSSAESQVTSWSDVCS
jgi:hypothetical protein